MVMLLASIVSEEHQSRKICGDLTYHTRIKAPGKYLERSLSSLKQNLEEDAKRHGEIYVLLNFDHRLST